MSPHPFKKIEWIWIRRQKLPALGFSVPEIIDPVFTKTSPKRSFFMTENERFGLVFTKTGSINSGTGVSGIVLKQVIYILLNKPMALGYIS